MNTSSINFDVAYKRADLRVAVDALKEWLAKNPGLTFFTFDQLCRDLSATQVSPMALNRVLIRLVAAGELRVKYRVKINEGEYSEEEFDSPEDVPACVFDSAFAPVEVYDEDKVPSYAPVR